MSVNIYVFVAFLVRIVVNCDLCLIREPEPSSPPDCRPPGARAEGDGQRNERQIRGLPQRAAGGPDALGCGGAGGELREQPDRDTVTVVSGGGRLAQRESASFTPRRSLVRSQYRPPSSAAGSEQGTGRF